MNIIELIDTLAATSGKLDKIDILKNNDNDVTRKVFYYAYSPKFVYGLKKVSPVPAGIDSETIDATNIDDIVSVLRGLHQRDYTGNAAKAAVSALLSRFDEASQTVIINIIKRDLRCGMDSSINKALPSLIEPDPAYMRCSTVEGGSFDKFKKEWFYSQVKADGMYLNLHVSKDRIFAETRNGTEFPIHKFPAFVNRIKHVWDSRENDFRVVFCGEIVMVHNGEIMPREASNGITNKITKGGEMDYSEYDMIFYTWDMIPEDQFVEKGKYNVRYEERFLDLHYTVSVMRHEDFKLIETKVVRSWDEAIEHYKECRARGDEGTVIKCPDAPWKDGTSTLQIKMKAEVDIDLRIHSLNPGEGKNAKTFGSILCYSDDGLVEGNVSGISDEQRLEIFENFEDYRNTILTVRSNNLTLARGSTVHKLFLPRAIEFRFDKNTADDLPRIKEIFASIL